MPATLLDLLRDILSRPLAESCAKSVAGLSIATMRGSREENQDRAMAVRVRRAEPQPTEFVVVALSDGMGGMVDGGGAATLAIAEFVAAIVEGFDGGLESVEDAAHNANIGVFERYRGSGGATLVAAVFHAGGEVYTAHCGDSRLYALSPGKPISLLTRDDTVAGLAAGDDLESEMDNRLLNFVGIGDGFAPTISKRAARADGAWLLTSDGVHLVGRRQMERVLQRGVDAREATERLLAAASAAGAPDNATAIAIWPERFMREAATHDSELMIWTTGEMFAIG